MNAVRQQIEIMQHRRQGWRGADRWRLLQVQTQYADLLGWLYQDSGDFQSSRRWIDRSLEWSHLARDSQTTAFILARKSHWARARGDALTVACQTGSARIITELARLDSSLAQWSGVPEVGEFRAVLTDAIPRQA